MRYIDSLHEGDRITEIYLCKNKQIATSKAGKQYENVLLQDKTGILDGKIWDPDSSGIEEFEAMDYVEVTGDLSNFQGKLQLAIKRVRKCREDQVDQSDYIPVSEKNIDEMYDELMKIVDTVQESHLNELLHRFFNNAAFAARFKSHSAAKSVHHGFSGGLLEHTLSVTKNCVFFAENYPYLKRDLLVTAAIFHDVGKLKELSTFPANDYTDMGQLLGHIVIGCEWVGEGIKSIKGFPPVLANELRHCILAHHGELEYGSPKKPAIMEAMALNFADNLDAKLETFKEALAGSADHGLEWQGFNRFLDSNIRRTSD